ncbi:MAG: hypothetical protein RLZZ517_310 [Candidatus Parcubacteria bacterium]|jgi:protoporphyrinogen oxidase
MNKTIFLETETLIIGAGPAGLACAMELFKKGKDFIILEKDLEVGGLSKTYKIIGDNGDIFFTDNGPHRFFSKNQYLYDFIEDAIDGDWLKVKRQTRQFIDGKFYDYPIDAFQALKNIGVPKATLMFYDYLVAKINYGILKKPVKNFRDYVVANFGRTLGEFNMINYTEKIWGISAQNIHQDWASQRIKGLNLRSVLFDYVSNKVLKKDPNAKSLIHEFYYPRKGSGQIYNSIIGKIISGNRKIFHKVSLQKVVKTENRFEVAFKIGDVSYVIRSKHLVESVPIKEFLQILEPQPPQNVLKDALELKYRSQVYLFVTLNKDKITDDQWIYFPSKKVSFGRISEMKNFSEYLSPKGKTSLFVEFFCTEGDDMWNMDKEEVLKLFIKDSENMNLFKVEDIQNSYLMKKRNIYPVYDLFYEEKVKNVKDFLDSVPNLFAIGRPGRFRYNNQDHSLEMGIVAAKSIIENKRYDIETIGSDKEYYEKK